MGLASLLGARIVLALAFLVVIVLNSKANKAGIRKTSSIALLLGLDVESG